MVLAGSEALVAGERVVMPAQPSRLTAGLVGPDEIARQKDECSKALDEQEQQGREALVVQMQRQREYIRTQAEQQKQIAAGRWDQHLHSQEMAAEQEYQAQLGAAREAAAQLRTVLENQAAQLVVEYKARKAELREWEMTRHLTPEQLLNAEERLRAQMAFAAQRNTVSVRREEGLPELPLSRWVPDGLGASGAVFGGVAHFGPGLDVPDLSAHHAVQLVAKNVSPYPLGCVTELDAGSLRSSPGAGVLRSSAAD